MTRDTLAEYEQWLAKWTEYCRVTAQIEATRDKRVGAALCMYAETKSGEIMSAVYIWTPAEAVALADMGLLGEIMWEQRASYTRVMQSTAERRKDPIARLTYGMYSILDLPHTGG